jgi:serine/threonine-protein kinase
MSAHRAVGILSQVASALIAAHGAGLIHRDVKPSNILVTTGTDGRDFAYLADFGISRSAGPDATGLTTGMMVLGTARYMPPEQFCSEAESRSDIYSLGAVLFRCLTGSVPFPKQELAAIAFAHCYDERPKVSDRAPWVGTQFDGVVRKAMAKKPAQADGGCAATALDGPPVGLRLEPFRGAGPGEAPHLPSLS